MAVHVDDLKVSAIKQAWDYFPSALISKFLINNLGKLRCYTSCAFTYDWDMGTLIGTKGTFIDNLVERFGVSFWYLIFLPT